MDYIINCVNNAFRFFILLFSIRARETKGDVFLCKEIMKRGIIKFMFIIILEGFNRYGELSFNIIIKLQEFSRDFKFGRRGKIINNVRNY